MEPTPAWTVVPFAAYLLGIALTPLVAGSFWARERNKLLVALVASLPVIAYLLTTRGGGAALARAVRDYLAFMALLGGLFTISGGVRLRGAFAGTTAANTAILAVGAVLGSVVGTTGASILLIRPLLDGNVRRARRGHLVVFFIFIVANAGGLLTPLGPPLFFGFLHGVPFTWTLRLAPEWALVTGILLAAFAAVDRVVLSREGGAVAPAAREPWGVDGARNLVWLAALIGLVFWVGARGARVLGDGVVYALVEIAGPLVLAALAFWTTPARVRAENPVSWAPLVEVAVVFVGVFVTMVPALAYVEGRGAALGVTTSRQFFWAAGVLSSVLDNAPTYLVFASLATGVAGALGGGPVAPGDLAALAAHPVGRHLLAAVSCGAVFMGAMTYIGNGPNFMVKAIAEEHGVRMPSFFGYVAWSVAIVGPVLVLVAYVFF
jgi:Na+/H+ antiporter NhaD/arsenite permease-like protein